jgi:hypothetical protein
LGFRNVPVGDTLPDPCLVFSDGTVAIGLHDREQPAPLLTFVRPGLKDYVRALRRVGVKHVDAQLADTEFNRVGFRDPTGQAVALLEARTFPPADGDGQTGSACGRFLEYSLPASSLERSRTFWEALGFAPVAVGEAPHPWARLQGHGLAIGLHEAAFHAGFSFRSPQLGARLEYLRAKGIQARTGNPLAEREQRSATLIAPEGSAIYLFEAGAQ